MTYHLLEDTVQQRKFSRKINSLIRRADKLDDGAVKAIFRLLRDARAGIANAITSQSAFDAANQAAIKAETLAVIDEFARKYNTFMDEALLSGWEIGSEIVDQSLTSSGAQLTALTLPGITTEQLAVLQVLKADLVTGLSQELRKAVQNEINVGILGQKTPSEVMKGIGGRITTKGTRFKSIAARAEAITRTEVNRVLNTANQIRGDQVAEVVPGLKKYWLTSNDDRVRPSHVSVGNTTNPASGGAPIGAKEKFTVSGIRVNGPHDPALPASEVVNCRCRVIYVLPDEQLN